MLKRVFLFLNGISCISVCAQLPPVPSRGTTGNCLAHNSFKNWDTYSELRFFAIEKWPSKHKLSMGTLVLALQRCRGSPLAVLPLEPRDPATRMELTRENQDCPRAQLDHGLLVHVQLTPGRLHAQPVSASSIGTAFPMFNSGHKFSVLLAAGSLVQKPMAFAQKIFYLL